MAGMRMFILIAMTLLLLHLKHAESQECPEIRNATKSSKIFLVVFDGSLNITSGRENAAYNLGECRSPEVHANEMIENFQTRYSFNLTHIRPNLFDSYDTDAYIVYQNAAPPGKHDFLVSSSRMGYAKFVNTPLYWAAWSLRPKRDITTLKGTIKANNWLSYGLMRFKIDGKDVCIEYGHRLPTGSLSPLNGPTPFDFTLRSPQLGEGQALGMLILQEGSYSMRYSLTFSD